MQNKNTQLFQNIFIIAQSFDNKIVEISMIYEQNQYLFSNMDEFYLELDNLIKSNLIKLANNGKNDLSGDLELTFMGIEKFLNEETRNYTEIQSKIYNYIKKKNKTDTNEIKKDLSSQFIIINHVIEKLKREDLIDATKTLDDNYFCFAKIEVN